MAIDRLALAIIQKKDADAVMQALGQAGLSATLITSTGGFLGTGNLTVLIGLKENQVDQALHLLETTCHKRTVHASTQSGAEETLVSGAIVFVSPIARYIRLKADGVSVDSHPHLTDVGAMKLILAIVAQDDSGKLLGRLTDWSYRATMISTTGSFLKHGNGTVLIGVRSERVDSIVDQIRQICGTHPFNEAVATIFVLDLARFERI